MGLAMWRRDKPVSCSPCVCVCPWALSPEKVILEHVHKKFCLISGGLGAPVFSLRDLLKGHAPWVGTSLVQGRDDSSVPQWESCLILERPLVLRQLFWQVLLEVAHCTCLIKSVCLPGGQLRGNVDPFGYPQVIRYLAYRRKHSQPFGELVRVELQTKFV